MEPISRIVNIADENGKLTGDTVEPWYLRPGHGITGRRGVDLEIGDHKVHVSRTEKRKRLRIFVDGREWKEAK